VSVVERPFYFIVSFWGEEFRNHFLRLCAPSLLAPGNIPALFGVRRCRLLICTTAEDWKALQADPLFALLGVSATLEFVELRHSVPDFLRRPYQEKLRRADGRHEIGQAVRIPDLVSPNEVASLQAFTELQTIAGEIGVTLTASQGYALRLFFMSAGHKVAAIRAHADGAYGVFLAPDMVLSDGAIFELDRLARRGSKVVMAAACRFAQEECLAAFRTRGLLEPGKPLCLAPRLLVEIVFEHLHPETAGFEFDASAFCTTATSALWRVPGDGGALLHSFFWAPLLVSYGDMRTHHADCFDHGGTTDGKYIAMHFDPDRDLTVIADSDTLMMASFTRNQDYAYPDSRGLLKRFPGFGRVYKIHRIHSMLYGPMGDSVKRRLYAVPVRFHSRPVSPAWEEVERRAEAVVSRALKKPSRLAAAWIRVSWFLSEQSLRSFGWFLVMYPVSKLSPHRRDQLRRLIGKSRQAA
jgi:hypothetical protein